MGSLSTESKERIWTVTGNRCLKFYKEDPKGVEIVCVAFEQTRNEKATRIAMNMIEDGDIPLEKIAKLCELPLEKVQELAKQKGA